MSVSEYTYTVQEQLVPKLQAIYNLNWKHNSVPNYAGKNYVDPVSGNYIYFWPTAMDYTVDGKVMQVKWEVVDHKVINVTFPHQDQLQGLSEFLQKYVWG